VFREIPWPQRLSVRLTAFVSGTTLVAIGAFVFVAVRAQRSHLEEVAVRVAALLSDSIDGSTRKHMLEDRREDAYAVMQTIARGQGIERVRIFNKEGEVTYSTVPAEIGSSVDKRAESCYACHAAGQPLERLSVPSRSRIYRGADGHRILAMVTPIYNEPSCSSADCHAHPASKRVLGVIDVGISLASVDNSLWQLEQRTLVGAALAVMALGAGLLWIGRRALVRPLRDLMRATERIAGGDLGYRIPARRADELGLLAASLNDMTDSLAAARAEIQGLMDGLEKTVEERTAALRETQAQLVNAAKLASLGRLAASIAHEINNPLAGILTFARLMLRELEEGELPDEQRDRYLKNLRLIERETQRCTTIVRNLLDFARQRPLTLTEADVNGVIEEALSLVGHQIELKGVALDKQLGSLAPIKADFGQIRQAFINIILNACDAMQPGGRLTIRTQPTPAGGVEVAFTDSGSGITAENLSHIFDPFFTTKSKGTGLGLSVVYGIIERHGGTLEADSQPGQGTTMRIRLPRQGAPDVA
jgi:two-component system NtrC family sensor kinase